MEIRFTIVAVAMLLSSSEALAGSPNGIGAVQLGMTASEVAALPDSGVHLVGPLVRSTQATQTEAKAFTSSIKTPWRQAPLPVTLHFEAGRLTSISVDLEDDKTLAQRIVSQITERHGEPSITDSRKSQTCPTVTDAHESVQFGMLTYEWADTDSSPIVRSHLSVFNAESCATRELNVDVTGMAMLTIRQEDTSTNPF